MNRPRQFSLSYFFLEVFWIATALGLIMQAFRLPETYQWLWLPLMIVGVTCAGAAIGRLFGNMKRGVLVVYAMIGGPCRPGGIAGVTSQPRGWSLVGGWRGFGLAA